MKGIKIAKGLAENFKQNVEIKLVWQVISSGIQGAPQTKWKKLKYIWMFECSLYQKFN